MTDVVAFIDALSPRELQGCFREWEVGEMDAGTPRVTPRVMSSIYTGQPPENNGMMEVSQYGGEQVTRPRNSTIFERLIRDGKSVLCVGMPFCIPFEEQTSDSVLQGTGMGAVQYSGPDQGKLLVQCPTAQADMIQDHPDNVFASTRDYTRSYFNQVKQAIRSVSPDVAFIGYRNIDSYCHFQHTESRGEQTYREHLIEEVANHLSRINRQVGGDVLYFSDHGQTKMTDVFRVNKWLKEKGYLEYTVDYDFIEDTERYREGESHPISERVENQVTVGSPGVVVDEESSDVICADPFDSCLTLLTPPDEIDTEAFRSDLLGTGMYRDVSYRWEMYDEGAAYYDRMPHVVPDRGEGVFVSGNLHRNPIGMGYYRTGVHDYRAVFGCSRELSVPAGDGRGGRLTPEQMYRALADFVGLGSDPSPLSSRDLQSLTAGERAALEADLSGVGK